MNGKPKKKTKRTLASHIVLFSLLLTLAFFLRMASIGLPPAWIDAMSEAFSTDRFALEMERVSISWIRGELDIGRIQVYPKGAVRLAVLEMSHTSVRLRPGRNKHPLTWLRSVTVRKITIPTSALEPSLAVSSDGLNSLTSRYTSTLGDTLTERDLSDYIPELRNVELTCSIANVLGTSGRRISATLTTKNNTLVFDNIKGNFTQKSLERQELEGHLEIGLRPLMLQGSGKGKIDPSKILPIFVSLDLPQLVSEIERIDFQDLPPEIDVTYQYKPSEHRRNLLLKFTTGYCLYNDTPLTSASGILRAFGSNAWDRVELSPLTALRPEGSATGSLDINTKDHTLRFIADSTLDPLHLLRIIRISSQPVKLPLAFDNPTRLKASGLVDLSDSPTRTDIFGTVLSPRISSYGVNFEDVEAQCHLTDKQWSVLSAKAAVYGGRFEGSAEFFSESDNPSEVAINSNGNFYELHHAQWSELFGTPSPDSTGILDLNYKLSGLMRTNSLSFIQGLHGFASLEMREAQLYRVPLFAGFTEIIAANIPSVDFVLAQDALDSSVTFTNGVLNINELNIKGNVFSASGYGKLTRKGVIDLNLKVHLLNRETWLGQGLYYILFPISKIFELQATGSINNPKWASATLSSKPAPRLNDDKSE